MIKNDTKSTLLLFFTIMFVLFGPIAFGVFIHYEHNRQDHFYQRVDEKLKEIHDYNTKLIHDTPIEDFGTLDEKLKKYPDLEASYKNFDDSHIWNNDYDKMIVIKDKDDA